MPSDENCCEHGDHPAPAGKRFCSRRCARCEVTECDAIDDCAGICGFGRQHRTEEQADAE